MAELPDGIYIRLKPETYFAQDRLGSTDMVTLHNRPADWWYGSRHNPHHTRTSSTEMDFGSALHLLVLEGETAYLKSTKLRPDEYPDEKTGELKPWHGGSKWCKAWLEDNEGPDTLILTEDMDRRLRHMAALIMNHPELGEPMRGGLSEVSVLYTLSNGLKCRARFDKLLSKFVLDLKTYGGDARGLDLTQQCLYNVKDRHMDVQRYMYFLARQAMAKLPIFGATPKEEEWLRRIAAIEEWRWCWLFYRRRDDQTARAPIVKPIYRSHFDGTFESGRQKLDVAVKNYLTFMQRFGTEVPWAIIAPGEEPPDHSLPMGLTDIPPPVDLPEIKEPA